MLPLDVKKLVTPVIGEFLDYTASLAGVCEDPPGSNRGPDIDAWAREFGSPVGSFWCALAVAHARKRFGLWVPRSSAGSCDEWIYQAFRHSLVVSDPVPGSAVVYTNGKQLTSGRYAGQFDAVHIGTVLRMKPRAMSWEGNTTLGKYDRNGYVLALKEIEHARVYAYILPERAA